MAAPKSKVSVRSRSVRAGRTAGKPSSTTIAVFIDLNQTQQKEAARFKLKASDITSKMLASNPKLLKVLLQSYGDAIAKSRAIGRRVSFRLDVEPDGCTTITTVEETAPAAEPIKITARDTELQAALNAARDRGRLLAAEVLGGDDMLSADAFAKMLGTTRVTVNTKRQSGQVLGLNGAKRGFRFPIWQLDAEGKPYAELPALHERLGDPWAVYRFLVQPHGELSGLTGLATLERGKTKAALAAAESLGRDFS